MKMFRATIATDDLELLQMDVEPAVSQGLFNKEIFIKNPEGYKYARSPGHVCRVMKAF